MKKYCWLFIVIYVTSCGSSDTVSLGYEDGIDQDTVARAFTDLYDGLTYSIDVDGDYSDFQESDYSSSSRTMDVTVEQVSDSIFNVFCRTKAIYYSSGSQETEDIKYEKIFLDTTVAVLYKKLPNGGGALYSYYNTQYDRQDKWLPFWNKVVRLSELDSVEVNGKQYKYYTYGEDFFTGNPKYFVYGIGALTHRDVITGNGWSSSTVYEIISVNGESFDYQQFVDAL